MLKPISLNLAFDSVLLIDFETPYVVQFLLVMINFGELFPEWNSSSLLTNISTWNFSTLILSA